ncbi:hypothetical protein BpHYR1_003262 [Brachionus plicatilis]|uniref:Uncharacterized protein n=1 Tax=Brachionus plicatilis TaxID=10195 RepID=A0A3M7P4K5_BRAPC|nr:hypothetical protein BpHYR1_003262 [Brachionus plicatilis]
MVKQKENEREPVRRSTRLTTKNNLPLSKKTSQKKSQVSAETLPSTSSFSKNRTRVIRPVESLESSDVEEFSEIEYDTPNPDDSQSNSSFKLIKERLIDHLTKLALNGVFEGKIFNVENAKGTFVNKKYSPVYNWFESKTKLKLSEKKNVLFKCRLCDPSLRKHNSAYITNQKLGKPGNLLKHLRTHKSDIGVWLNEFDNNNSNNYLKKKIDPKFLHLVKFFIKNSIAVKALEDKDLRAVFPNSIGKYSFVEKTLPELFLLLMHGQVKPKKSLLWWQLLLLIKNSKEIFLF